MSYRTILTNTGLAAIAAAHASGVPLNLVAMAIGDGDGNDVEPQADQVTLVREVYRTTINRLEQDPDEPTRYTAELVIPAAVGGFVMRELGLFDVNNNLVAVANLPATFKPAGDGSDGILADDTIRIQFAVDQVDALTLVVDANVSIATRSWVLNNTHGIPPGGTTGQLLIKQSNADYDANWQDPTEINVVVRTVEENQTLAAGQTDITLAVCTTYGLAVFINGTRLRSSQWTPNATDPTKLTLLTAAAAGDKFTGVQNEQTAQTGVPLLQAQNLADLPDKAVARANLGVYSKAEVDQRGPAGMVAHFASSTAPDGWLKANGATISRTSYAALFARIGTTYGAGDGATTFKLPDLRGEFIRGWDDGRGVDPGRAFGSAQASLLGQHSHTGTASAVGSHSHVISMLSAGSHSHSGSIGAGGGHNHGGSIGDAGAHAHNYRDRYYAESTAGINGSGGATYKEAMSGYNNRLGSSDTDADNDYFLYKDSTTAGVADHTHSLTINSVGDHTHAITISSAGSHSHSVTAADAGGHSHTISIGSTGGAETRPRNVALLACIKY